MTPSMSESEPITSNEPVVDGPTGLPAGEVAEAAAETPPEAPASTPAGEESVVDRVRRRLRTQMQPEPEPDRMRTLEERLMKLEELLTRQEEMARAPVEVAEVAAPVAPLIAQAPVAAPMATVIDPPVAAVAPPADAPAADLLGSRWHWLILPTLFQGLKQGFNNVRLFLRMYVDPRYKMSWLGRLVPLAFLFFFVFSDWDWEILNIVFFWNMIPIFGSMIDKLLLIVFAWLTAKVLSREMRRYQQVVPDVPDALRWGNR
jgi:hypothetical protein